MLHLLAFFLLPVSGQQQPPCLDNIGEALGTSDYLLYGLTAECDIFFASSVPDGTDLSEHFGPKVVYKRAKNGTFDEGNINYRSSFEMYQCGKSKLYPVRDSSGSLKLVMVGTIVKDTSGDYQRYQKSTEPTYVHVFDFKLPSHANGEWFTTSKFTDCERRWEIDHPEVDEWEMRSFTSRVQYQYPPFGDHCQYSPEISNYYDNAERIVFAFGNELFVARLQNRYKGQELGEDDAALNVVKYKLDSNGTLLLDVDGPISAEEAFSWKLIKKPWDELKVEFNPQYFLRLSDEPWCELVVDQVTKRLYLIGKRKMRQVDVAQALTNPNAFYASTDGVDFPKDAHTANLAKVGGYERVLRLRYIVNDRMINIYDRYNMHFVDEFGGFINRSNHVEVWVLPISSANSDQFGEEATAKCIARVNEKRTPNELFDRNGTYTWWSNFQLSALVGADYRQLQGQTNANEEVVNILLKL